MEGSVSYMSTAEDARNGRYGLQAKDAPVDTTEFEYVPFF